MVSLLPFMGTPRVQAQEDPEYTSDAHAEAVAIEGAISGAVDLDIDMFPSVAAASEGEVVTDRDTDHLVEVDPIEFLGITFLEGSAIWGVGETDREQGYAHAWGHLGSVSILDVGPLGDPVLELEALSYSSMSHCRDDDAERLAATAVGVTIVGQEIDIEEPEVGEIDFDDIPLLTGGVALLNQDINDEGDVLEAQQTIFGFEFGVDLPLVDVFNVSLDIGDVTTTIDCSEGPDPGDLPDDELWADGYAVDVGTGGLISVGEDVLPSTYIGAPPPQEEDVEDTESLADLGLLDDELDLDLPVPGIFDSGAINVRSSGHYGEDERWAQSDGELVDISLFDGQFAAQGVHGFTRSDCFDLNTPTWAGTQFGTFTILGEQYSLDAPNFDPVEIDFGLGDLVGIEGAVHLFAHEDNIDTAEEDGFVHSAYTIFGLSAGVNFLGLNQSIGFDIGTGAAHTPCEDIWDDDPPVDEPLSLDKSAQPDSFEAAGDEITYTLTATNNTDGDITGVVVEDEMLPDLACDPEGPADLGPGEQMVCTEVYTVTDEDVAAGEVVNVASVGGEDDDGDDVGDDDEVVVPGPDDDPPVDEPLSLDKSAQPDSFEAAGDEITYTLTATNNTDGDITGVVVEDEMLPDLACDPEGPADLGPGEQMVCTEVYAVTDEDVAAGEVVNVASVGGEDDDGDDVGDDDEVVVPGPEDPPPPEEPPLSLDKTADPMTFSQAGDEITYTLTATNNTESVVTGVEITDEMLPNLECEPEAPADLGPGEQMVCTEVYIVTAEDVAAGEIINEASVIGQDEDDDDLEDDDDVIVVIPDECPLPTSPTEGLERLSGENRVETAISISQNRWVDACAEHGEFDSVALARADVFADSLAGTALAAQHDAPLLITASDELYEVVADEIQRLLPDGGTVYLLGGTEALDENVESSVADLGLDIERIGGPSRFETAGLIAERLGDRENVLVATGADHADALTAGTAAVEADGAVLLTPDDEPHNVVDEYLEGTDAEAWAIGGAAAAAYPNVTALMGATRDGTAVEVAEQFFDEPTHVGIARRDDFPDALGGGAHIGPYGGPLVLSYPDSVSEETAEYLEGQSLIGGYVYGGTHAVNEATFSELEGYFGSEGANEGD